MRALLVDFGGVLTTNVFHSFRRFCEREGLDPEHIKRVFSEDPEVVVELRRLERGELSEDEFGRRFGARLGIEDLGDVVNRLFAELEPDHAMIDAVRAARGAGVRTGLISNSWGTERYDRSVLSELFDDIVISGEVGLHKPAPEIYELAAELVGVAAAECVFVDDLRENCEGAEAVGMTAVLHRGAERTLPELERLLGVALR
jgi:putative hydrolase of the HAD superfamily